MDANHHLQTRLYRCLCAQSESIEIMMSDSLIHFQTLCNSQGAPCASVRAEGEPSKLDTVTDSFARRGGMPRGICFSRWGSFAQPHRHSSCLPRKEVIQPHLPVRLPCYDFTPLTLHTFGASPLAVGPATSGADDSGGVTGGVYKARERIHRGMLIRDY